MYRRLRCVSVTCFTPSLRHDWPLLGNLPGWFPWEKGRTQRCPQSRHAAGPARRGRVCVWFSNSHTDWTWISTQDEEHTHVGHVTDCHELAGSGQVEAVNFVLHAARYFTVAATEVCNHERGRSEINDTNVTIIEMNRRTHRNTLEKVCTMLFWRRFTRRTLLCSLKLCPIWKMFV